MALKICPKCGNKTSELAPRCPLCGLPLSEFATYHGELPVSPAASAPHSEGVPMWLIAIIVVVFLGVGGVFFFMSGDSKESTVSSRPAHGEHKGHTWVDLGLSVMWASCNVGAHGDPAHDGDHYQWGETYETSCYRSSNCDTYGDHFSSEGIGGKYSYDAATSNWNGGWRMPTPDEFQELLDKCTFELVKYHGQSGYSVTGPNGNKIFLPAAGYYDYYDRSEADRAGYYWASAPYDGDRYYSVVLKFNIGINGDVYLATKERYYGCSVRPVCPRSVADEK